MKISVLSVFPQLYDSFLSTSLLKRAQQNGLITVETDTFFSFVEPKQRIDAPSFGPGAGMLIKPQVVEDAISHHETAKGKALKIFFSPQGRKLDQAYLSAIAKKAVDLGHIMLIPARYEGMDARVEAEYADELVSVGDFVLMSGDLPAMIFIEAFARLIPGVIGKQESVEKESFSGPFVDYPEFTDPLEWHGKKVPDIVRSGNHAAVDAWRQDQAVTKTVMHHFDWLRSYPQISSEHKALVQKTIPPHYAALCHCDVYV